MEAYARLLVGRCLDVQPGWQVTIRTTPLARELVEAVTREVAARGAYALPRYKYGSERFLVDEAWAAEAPEELLEELPPVERHWVENDDARMSIMAPENTRDGAELDGHRLELIRKALVPSRERSMSGSMPWVLCQYPTPALAQEAGMALGEFEDFLYGACLLDWDEVGARMRRIADRFDVAEEVRIVAAGTDLTLSVAGRPGEVGDGKRNMPGGEVFYAPVEDSANGVVEFGEFPALREGHEVTGARLVFRDGVVVEADAQSGAEFLHEALDLDAGARRLGELGIGCNEGVTRYMKNTLFDEKMAGTVHLALGQSYTFIGGRNTSAIHWDLVKDLRAGGRLYADGELVQENGSWLL